MKRSATDRKLIRRIDSARIQRAGFSLMELFVVIAILSVMILVSWPMLRRPLNKSIVQDAAQQLRRDLGSARLQAVDTGRVLVFQFRPGTSTYYVGTTDQRSAESKIPAREDSRSSSEMFQHKSARSSSQFGERDVIDVVGDESLKELPFGTSFAATSPTSEDEISPTTDWKSGKIAKIVPKTGEPIDSELAPWSAPIRFYPSGRCNPASIPLTSEQGYFADVDVQGLAGRIKISAIRR